MKNSSFFFLFVSLFCFFSLAQAEEGSAPPAPTPIPALTPATGVSGQADPSHSAILKNIGDALQKKFPQVQIMSVHKTPYLGLYEVDTTEHVFYTDESMHYLFDGNIVDFKTLQNLTADREKELFSPVFKDLPFALALKEVRGNGKRKLAIFTDPNCPYCKKLEKEMEGMTNITAYIFVFPILAGSEEKAKAILCSKNPLDSWHQYLLSGVNPVADKACDTSTIVKTLDLARKLKVTGTPTLIFEDGTVQPGVLTRDQLEKQLDAAHIKAKS